MNIFAYLLLLEDPEPPPFICIEEPENGLYHKLLETLANEFRAHAIDTLTVKLYTAAPNLTRALLSLEPNDISFSNWSCSCWSSPW